MNQKRNEPIHACPITTTDRGLVVLLNRLAATVDPNEIRELSDQIEKAVFHKQFRNASVVYR